MHGVEAIQKMMSTVGWLTLWPRDECSCFLCIKKWLFMAPGLMTGAEKGEKWVVMALLSFPECLPALRTILFPTCFACLPASLLLCYTSHLNNWWSICSTLGDLHESLSTSLHHWNSCVVIWDFMHASLICCIHAPFWFLQIYILPDEEWGSAAWDFSCYFPWITCGKKKYSPELFIVATFIKSTFKAVVLL